MLLQFYGLREQPFGVAPNPDYLYLSGAHQEALASLVYGVEAAVGFSALVAPPGMGKTTLLYALRKKFQNATRSAFLCPTQCDSRELLQNLLEEFEIDKEGIANGLPSFPRLGEFLFQSARARRPVLVIVDEAQNLEIPALETLRLLSNFETLQSKLLHIVLAGQPEFARKLAQPELEQLRQRIAIFSRLNPFSLAESVEYIVHRLRCAGYQGGPLFTAEALELLVACARGTPREINRLCFHALSLGFGARKRVIGTEIVQGVLGDLERDGLLGAEGPGHRTMNKLKAYKIGPLFNRAMAQPGIEKADTLSGRATACQALSERAPQPASVHAPRPPTPGARQPGIHPVAAGQGTGDTRRSSPIDGTPEDFRRHKQPGKWGEFVTMGLSSPSGPPVLDQRTTKQSSVPAGLTWGALIILSAALLFADLVRSGAFSLSAFSAVRRGAAALPDRALANGSAESQRAAKPILPARQDDSNSNDQSSSGSFHTKNSDGAAASHIPLGKNNAESGHAPKPIAPDRAEKHGQPWQMNGAPTAAAPSYEGGSTRSRAAMQPGEQRMEPPAVRRFDDNSPAQSADRPNGQEAPSRKTAVPGAGDSNLALPSPPAANAVAGNLAATQAMAAILRPDPGTVPADPAFAKNRAAPRLQSPESDATIARRLLKRVAPVYPKAAQAGKISGEVVLTARIDASGHVEAVQAVSGDPILADAALAAVRQWVYEPLQNRDAQPSDETVIVNFSLH